jgi:hypothetical protein
MPVKTFLAAKLHRFFTRDDGAVTVDWVVLAAAVTGLGIGAVTLVRGGTQSLGDDVETSLSGAQVASLSCLGSNGNHPAGWECYDGPTITGTGMGWGYAWMPACYVTGDGAIQCDGSGGSQITEEVFMSDGQTYYRNTRTENGETTVTWTDQGGNPVDAPPPQV